MENLKSHTFIKHACGGFCPEALRSLRLYLQDIEMVRQAKAQTDREKAALARGETSDAIRLDVRWFEPWRTALPSLLNAVRPFTWISYPVQVRLVREVGHLVPWHQDIAYQHALGNRGHRQIITCFVPLDDDPYSRATVEFSPEEHPYLEHVPTDGFAAGILDREFGGLFHFKASLGDALVFGDLALHRSCIPAGAKVERASIEFRLIQPADALDDKDYFDIESGLFVRKDGTRRKQP